MAGETKSNGQKDLLDRFYTDESVLNKIKDLLNLEEFNTIIEPSAGRGDFLNILPKTAIAYDIDPKDSRIERADWLKVDKTKFVNHPILVCGNPPFGQQNRLAIKFINESAKFADCIAFILPLSFKKDSIKDRINLNFWLKKEVIIDDALFNLPTGESIKVPCVFQIWEKREISRTKSSKNIDNNYIKFVDKSQADFTIQRVGGNAGKASPMLDKSTQSNYFVKNISEYETSYLIDFINNINFEESTFTVGPKSLSKKEIVDKLKSLLD